MPSANMLESVMASGEKIAIEVAYARPDKQLVISLSIPKGFTLEEAIQASGILEQFPEINLEKNKVGIFGKLSSQDRLLRSGDRVEIYRPLIADPKQARRERAAKTKRAQ
jgi:uncharacterized protein